MTDAKDDNFSISTFRDDESGAVTADWVVLTAAVVLLSIPLMMTIRSSTQTAATNIADGVVAATQ